MVSRKTLSQSEEQEFYFSKCNGGGTSSYTLLRAVLPNHQQRDTDVAKATEGVTSSAGAVSAYLAVWDSPC